jgi:hypothetical protein
MVNTKEGCVVPLESPRSDADIRVAVVDGADGAISGERVDRALDEPAVVQQPIAPQLEVLVPCALDHGERRFADHVSTGNRLDGHERGRNDGSHRQRRDQQHNSGDSVSILSRVSRHVDPLAETPRKRVRRSAHQ